ncbi:MAG: class I SAM-dependent methyltransferase [Pedobacter sp.]|nr:MAG: class I SAM-dependent methyltransferase [Pedobacter sp.]
MDYQPTEEQLKELAHQLSRPTGENGIRTADQMHISNIGMTRNTIAVLNLQNNDSVLELGHGNGSHINEIVGSSNQVVYQGLEISDLMMQQASTFNEVFVREGKAKFEIYDGENIPFKENSFDKIMTVNTLYFWKNPVLLLNELYRVLKPEGLFCCTFAPEDFMKNLPFTKFVFKLYDSTRVEELAKASNFQKVDFSRYAEQITNRDGLSIERDYMIATFRKQSI